MNEMIVGKNWANLIVALGLAIVPLFVTLSKNETVKTAQIQVATVQVAETSSD